MTVQSFVDQLGELSPAFGSTLTPDPIDDLAVYDFAYHEFLVPIEDAETTSRERLSAQALAYLDALEAAGVPEAQLILADAFFGGLEASLRAAAYANFAPQAAAANLAQWIADLHTNHLALLNKLLGYFVRLPHRQLAYFRKLRDSFLAYMRTEPFRWRGWEVFEFVVSVFFGVPFDDPNFAQTAIGFGVSNLGNPQAPTRGAFEWWLWLELQKPPLVFDPGEFRYPFLVAAPLSVNFGLRRVHRQYWRLLGRQKGEVIRTVPLGPGQTERVTTKIIRRRRTEETRQTQEERETTTETVDTVKDSSELVNEASNSFNWNVSTTASASFGGFGGFGSASTTAGVGGANEDRSRDTSSRLSESMQKAASKVRSETQVIVKVEGEIGFEEERFSEIVNPNNEIAITYEYHKLQHRYEVFTELKEVQSVIYVAETLPEPDAIGAEWARRHDWILMRALLDQSFRVSLQELSQDAPDEDPMQGVAGDPLRGMFDAAVGAFASFNPNSAGTGLTIPDIYAAPQEAYREHLNAAAARRRANAIREAKHARLFRHLRDNILHYQQAIWAREHPDQRILRYTKEGRVVPLRWIGANPQLRPDGTYQVTEIVPDGDAVPLVEVIEPTGPIAYFGNYAVFELSPVLAAPEARVAAMGYQLEMNLAYLLQMSRAPYYDPQTEALIDPGLRAERERQRARWPNGLIQLTDAVVFDLVSYLPHLADALAPDGRIARDPNDATRLAAAISADTYAEYVFRRDTTRRFLVDSNNLYLSLQSGEGAALEPFKRAHRLLDVLKTEQEVLAMQTKNARRAALVADAGAFDPDIEKVIVVPSSATAIAAAGAATTTGVGAAPGGARTQPTRTTAATDAVASSPAPTGPGGPGEPGEPGGG